MTDQVLDHAFKRLLLAHQPIAQLEPVLQDLARAARGVLQLPDVRLELRVGETVQRRVRGGAEPSHGCEVQLGRRRWAATAGGGGFLSGCRCRGPVVTLGVVFLARFVVRA